MRLNKLTLIRSVGQRKCWKQSNLKLTIYKQSNSEKNFSQVLSSTKKRKKIWTNWAGNFKTRKLTNENSKIEILKKFLLEKLTIEMIKSKAILKILIK